MVTTVFATKLGMTQAWTTTGKRVAVTRCKVEPNMVVGTQVVAAEPTTQILEIGYGKKKLKNVHKPLRSQLEKGGFSIGAAQVRGIRVAAPAEGETAVTVGQTLVLDNILQVGDVVRVQGTSKGRGFAGAMKRHGFHGGPMTHGQSDRSRAVGSIGAGTTPGRVFKGQRMPGHFGVETTTVPALVVLKIDSATQEVWLSGPVPGHLNGVVRIEKTGKTKQMVLDLPVVAQATEVNETPAAEAPATEELSTEEATA